MDRFQKWRLILGKKSDPKNKVGISAAQSDMDGVLEALYDSERKGGLGASSPNVNRWLGDIRKYFPSSTVQVMQKDALDRLELKKILTQPELLEMMEPDANLVATLISLNKVMPTKTKETAKIVVRKVVEELEKRLRPPLQQAITGALNRSVRNRRPKLNEIDWSRTIRVNLKNYQQAYNAIIPETLIGHKRKGHSLKEIILLVDQSGSMASSLVYASVFGSVMASMRSLETHFVAFDMEVADLTEKMQDPVELLFGVQLGGGTDINKALGYGQRLVKSPKDAILVLITDLFEGGDEKQLLKKAANLKSDGVRMVVLLALDDKGAPVFNRPLASNIAALSIPAFACSPNRFPELMEAVIKDNNLERIVDSALNAQ